MGASTSLSPARFPTDQGEKQLASAFPYTVIGGVGGQTAEVISRELSKRGDILCHARLFAPGEVRSIPATRLRRAVCPPHPRRGISGQTSSSSTSPAARRAARLRSASPSKIAMRNRRLHRRRSQAPKMIWYRGAWALDLFRRAQALDEIGLAERAIAASVAERGPVGRVQKGRGGADHALSS